MVTAVNRLSQWARDLPDEFLLCRDFGHTWRPHTARLTVDGTYERVMRCARCHTERIQYLSVRGEVLSGRYDYAEGYTAPRGQGHLDHDQRSELRLESTLRLISRETGPERPK